MSVVRFRARIAKSGKKYYIEIPLALHLQIEDLLGLYLEVTLDPIKSSFVR
jgi:hypothetical protein